MNSYLARATAISVLLAVLSTQSGHACIGESGQVPTIRSLPALRPKPQLIPEGLAAAGRAQVSSEYVLVLLVDFSDCYGTTTQENWRSEMFGDTYSMADYYNEVSYYSASVTGLNLVPAVESSGTGNGIAGWYRIKYRKVDSQDVLEKHPWNELGEDWQSDDIRNCHNVVKAAVCSSCTHVNYPQFDSNNDSFISADELHIIVVLAGYEGSYYKDKQPATWRCRSGSTDGVMVWNAAHDDSVVVLRSDKGGGYVVVGELAPTGCIIKYGLVCHEMGHDLGLPDLYDTDKTSEPSCGVGEWCLMGSGDWCSISTAGDCPSHLCAWSKIHLGWISPTLVSWSSNVKIPQVETNPVAYKLLGGEDEYFLVTNRQRVGYDQSLVRSGPARGLLIWHIDEAAIDSLLSSNSVNADEAHKGVDLECADAYVADHVKDADDLDKQVNRGDSTDPWYPGNDTDFKTSSVPDNRDYDGYNSIVEVTWISASSDTMTAAMRGALAFEMASVNFGVNGQCAMIPGASSGDTLTYCYVGRNCSAVTDLYEWDASSASWMKANTWGWNVPRHSYYQPGNEIRHQQVGWSGDFKMVAWGLCGLGCDEPSDSGFDVDVGIVEGAQGTSASNGWQVAGWNIGFRDSSSDEFGDLTDPYCYYDPTMIGDPLVSFPAEMGIGAVEELYLDFAVTPNLYWEDMVLVFSIAEVTSPGFVEVLCSDAEFSCVSIWIEDPGYYQADLGWIHADGPTATTLLSSDAAFAWDWMSLMTATSSLDLIEPAYVAITNDNEPGFAWTEITNATRYRLQIAEDCEFSSPVVDDSTLIGAAYTPSGPLDDAFYFWRVATRTPFSGWSAWSCPSVLTVDTESPVFSWVTLWPDTGFGGPYHIEACVTDDLSGLTSALLCYRFGEGAWDSTLLALADTSYVGWIPAVTDSSRVDYYFRAADAATNTSTDPEGAPGSFHRFNVVTAAVRDSSVGNIPTALVLSQNYPNPFMVTTEIRYALPRDCYVKLDVFNTQGQKVVTLVDAWEERGSRAVRWDTEQVAGGMYFLRLAAGDAVKTRKMVLLK